MAGSTFRGRYPQCKDCEYQLKIDGNKFSCSYSHKMIRKYANGTGIELSRDFEFCGLYKYNEINTKEIDASEAGTN